MFTVEDPELIIEKLREYFSVQNFPIKEDEVKYKLEAKCSIQGDQTIISARIEKVEEGVNCIRMKMIEGNKMDFFDIFKEIQEHLDKTEAILNY